MENEPLKVSVVFETLGRIDKKLDDLAKRLEPIIRNLPSSDQTNEAININTELSSRLIAIENKITLLLDTIEL